MSASFRIFIGSLAAGLCCLPLGAALAQQSTASPRAVPGQAQPNDPNAITRGNQATSPRLNPATPSPAQPYTARYGTEANEGQHNGVDQFFANCLLKSNQAEIEISQFAAQKSENPKVKQYAEQLVKDHQQVVQKLQQIAGANAHQASNGTLEGAAQTDANRLAVDTTRTPGSSGTDTAAAGTEGLAATRNPAMRGDAQLMQVGQIEEKINDRYNQAIREELQQKSGAEFDQCYLGAQVGGHMYMLAELEVIPGETQGQLKQIADDARPTVQKHLDQAKDLMKQLQSGENSNSAERSTTRSER
jgi:predicted outer membrane protein